VQFGATGSLLRGTYPSAGNLLTGSSGTDLPSFSSTVAAGTYQFFKSDGTRVSGNITDAGTVTPSTSAQTFSTSLYKGFAVAAVNNSIDANIIAGNIKSGVSIAGVTGTMALKDLIGSGAHRDQAATQMTYAQELGLGASVIWRTITSGNTGYGYREVSLPTKDDDGNYPDSPMRTGKLVRNRVVALRSDGSGVTTSNTVLNAPAGTFTNVDVNDSVGIISSGTGTVTQKFYTVSATNNNTTVTLNAAFVTVDATNVQFFVDRPTSTGNWDVGVARKVCGKTDATVTSKIADCAAKNPSVATWDGTAKGISGEGSWTLVTVYSSAVGDTDGTTCNTTACYEVWRDNRTGLLWSDALDESGTTTFNWCHASGANNSSSVNSAYRSADPNGYCAPSNGTGVFGYVDAEPIVEWDD
jgi:hypothetical protein